MSRKDIITTAAAENGYKESPSNSNKTKYGEWYNLNGVKWCAIFISWVFDKSGHPLGRIDTDKGFHYCPSGFNHWKKKGEFTNNPQEGDIALYDWDGDGICDHTGIFVRWINDSKTSFESWEGNTAVGDDSNGGQVMLRQRKTSTVKAFVSPGILGSKKVELNNEVKYGDSNANVTIVQKMLYDLKYTIQVDGYFGAKTLSIVKQFQNDYKLPTTGIVTPEIFGAMEDELNRLRISEKKITTGSYIKKGDCGAVVVAIQQALNKKNKSAITIDGVFGKETKDAVILFQKNNKLLADGIVGPITFAVLQIKDI